MTATIIETREDLDMSVLDELDFKAELSCENKTQTGVVCDHKAEWIVRHQCCEVTKLLCTFHKEILVVLLSRWNVIHSAKADGCGKDVDIKSIDRI